MQEQDMPETSTQDSSSSSPSAPVEMISAQPETLEQFQLDLAERLAEDPRRLVPRKEVTHLLEKMTEGVIVELHIGRPRFSVAIARKRKGTPYGLEKLGLRYSEPAQKILRDYFSLGRHSLLPSRIQKELATIESAARACLDRSSFKTHWGYFVPWTNYQAWKEENLKHEQKFNESKTFILEHYDEIQEEVVAIYRQLAEESWMQLTVGDILNGKSEDLSQALEEVMMVLRTQQGKETFIETYLEDIRQAMPDVGSLEDAFFYEAEYGYIPLPSLLARDINQADSVSRERALRDASLQAELATIEARRRAELAKIAEQQRLEEAQQRVEWDKLTSQQRQEQAIINLRLQQERKMLEEKAAMDRDVLDSARRRKTQLVQDFYEDIIGQINALIEEVCSETLQSLDEQGGILRGPVSARLGNLVTRLTNLNFVHDEQIEQQIERIRSILPTEAEQAEAKKGIARIETTRIRKVVQQLQEEAEETLLELGIAPIQRRPRQVEGLSDGGLILDEKRTGRSSLGLKNPGIAGSRRRNRGMKL